MVLISLCGLSSDARVRVHRWVVFLDFALTVGSPFTVGVADEDRDTASRTEMVDAPERVHKIAAAPEPAPIRELTESAPEPAPIRELTESAPEPAPIRELTESAPEPAPIRELTESAPEPAPIRELTESGSPSSPLRSGSSQSPALLRLRWSRPALLRLRWSRPALLRLRRSRPALLRLRWSRPARLRLRWSWPRLGPRGNGDTRGRESTFGFRNRGREFQRPW